MADIIDIYLIDDSSGDRSVTIPRWLIDPRFRIHNVQLQNNSSWIEQCVRRAAVENHSNNVIFFGSRKIVWNLPKPLINIYNNAVKHSERWDLLYLGVENDHCKGYAESSTPFDDDSSLCNTQGAPLAMMMSNATLKRLAQAIRNGNHKLPVVPKVVVPHPVIRDYRVSSGNICYNDNITRAAPLPVSAQRQIGVNLSNTWAAFLLLLIFVFALGWGLHNQGSGHTLAMALLMGILFIGAILFLIALNYNSFTN